MFEPTIRPYAYPISRDVLALAWEEALKEWEDPVLALWLANSLFAPVIQIQRSL